MKQFRYYVLFLLGYILVTNASAQSNYAQQVLALKERIGDKYFRNMSYVQAIATYENILKEDTGYFSCLPNLAESYRKIYDMKAAEDAFAKLVQVYPGDSTYLLGYAQTLAINGKYNEAATYYERYAQRSPHDSRGKAFAEAYRAGELFQPVKGCEISIANFNTDQSDFGPVYYQYGLVFSSARRISSIIQRSFSWDLSTFLDLYYIKDTSDIKPAEKIDTIQGKSKRRKIRYNDDDTRYTSNDTKTMAGYISQKYIDTSGMFATQPFLIDGFSKSINSKFHEGPVVFNKKQTKIYFTRNNYYNMRSRKSSEGVNRLKIFEAEFNGVKWVNITPLTINNNEYSVGHPALSNDDSLLYFASDMPGGYGGVDLYYVKMDGKGHWGIPVNLGNKINTEGNEVFPYIDHEGTLYFASNGHPGLGGLDLFSVSFEDTVVRNLGVPVNSNADDFSIALDKTNKQGYMSSNRRRGYNDDDIYKITVPKPDKYLIRVVDSLTEQLIPMASAIVKVKTTNADVKTDTSSTGQFNAKLWATEQYAIDASALFYIPSSIVVTADPLNPVITIKLKMMPAGCIVAGTIRDKDSRQPINGARLVIYDKTASDTVFNFTTSDNGYYRYTQLKSSHIYLMDVSGDGYFNKPAIELNTSDNKCLPAADREYDYLRDFELEKIVVGKAIKIENIYFDLAKYNIRKSAAVELDKIVKLMTENPDIIIELSSHTDCRASFQYNMTLSDNRAKASASYIISKGINKERITGKGYGETKLVNDCACEGTKISRPCSEEEHQANRRTEFQVTGFLSDKNAKILNDGKGEVRKSVDVPKE